MGQDNERRYYDVLKICVVTQVMRAARHRAEAELDLENTKIKDPEKFNKCSLLNNPLSVPHSELVSEQKADCVHWVSSSSLFFQLMRCRIGCKGTSFNILDRKWVGYRRSGCKADKTKILSSQSGKAMLR